MIAGPQRRTRLMSEKEKLITAYHEGGHALVAAAVPGTDPVHKVTILPRGRALGYTMVLPDEDKYSQTRSEMLDKLAYMLGGMAAEALIFHDVTSGAGNDIEKATSLARAMVTQYGMSERLGAIKLGDSNSEPFLGRDMGHQRNYSEEVAAVIDAEVKTLLGTAHQEAFDILEQNRDVLDALVLELLDKETLDKAQIARIFEPLRLQGARPAWTGSPDRNPSAIPPVEIPQEIRDRARNANGTAPDQAGGRHRPHPARRRWRHPRRHRGRHRHPRRPPRRRRPERADAMTDPISLDERELPDFDHARAEAAVRELLHAIGEDPEREGLRDTPARVARAYAELTAGLRQRPEDVLTTTFDIGHDEMVLVRDIELWSMCEHHLVPFTGVAHVGYIPAETGKITGLSKLARLVDVFAKRPQVQERLTTQVADALMEILEPRGVIVVIEAEHLCMTMRGVRKAGRPHHHVGGARHHAQRRHALRGDGADPLPPMTAPATRPLVMGIVNVTPDSFSDGGLYADTASALAHGRELLAQGADVLDVGGESTRPGATRPVVAEELDRVVPVISGLAALGAVVSVDTMRAEVAAAALDAGARIVNDVSGGLADPAILDVVAGSDATYVAMHWRAHSDRMADFATYDGPGGVVAAVVDELGERLDAATAAGIDPDRVVLDPGLGFAKRGEHNWAAAGPPRRGRGAGSPAAGRAPAARASSAPCSPAPTARPRPPGEREHAHAALVPLLADLGVWGLRVHDVRATTDALAAWQAWRTHRSAGPAPTTGQEQHG